MLIVMAMEDRGKVYSIVRKSLPSLKMTAYRDFFEILNANGLYDEARHNKSDYTYELNGNLFEFISLDDVTYIQSTYLDNPFLDASIVEEIERLQHTDNDYWRIYGLGERGMSRATIFQYGQAEIPTDATLLCHGMDFGYTNDPTALVAVYKSGDNLYVDELIYRTGMTNPDISNVLKSLNLDRRAEVFADSAEPKSIEELHRMGWNVKPTQKGADSVIVGIDVLKRHKLFVTPRSSNLIKELQNYKWVEDKNGNLLNKPIDAFNHAIDALRYATYNKLSRPNFGRYAIR